MGEDKDEEKPVTAAIVLRREEDERVRLVEPVNAEELRQNIDDFLRAKYPHGALAALEVKHTSSRLSVDRISGEHLRSTDAICARIERRIHADARNLRRNVAQEYVVSAFYGEGDTARFATAHCRVRVKWSDDDDESDARDRPVDANIVRSLQKVAHNALEYGQKSTKGGWSVLLRVIERQDAREDRYTERIDKLEEKLDRVQAAKEDALDRSQDRKDKAEDRKVWRNRLGDLFDTVKVMLPWAMAKWGGQKDAPLPAFAHPLVEQGMALFDVVTKDEQVMETVITALMKNEAAYKAFNNFMSIMQDAREVQKERARVQVAAEERARNGDAGDAKGSNGHARPASRPIPEWW